MKKFETFDGIRCRKSNFLEMKTLAAKLKTADDYHYVWYFEANESLETTATWGVPQPEAEINDSDFDVHESGFGVDIVEISKAIVRKDEHVFDHYAGEQCETFPDDVDESAWIVVGPDDKPVLCGICTVYSPRPEELERD